MATEADRSIPRLWMFFYDAVFIPVFWIGLVVGSVFKRKIRRGIEGRRNLFESLKVRVHALKATRRVWFHASSLGEFEQAKPIIAALKRRYKNIDIVASFFSPSGYDHSKNYQLADVITYIPLDTAANARRFLDLLRPTAAVMVRYDVWPNHLLELSRRKIPTFIANATMRRNSARLYPFLRSFHRALYDSLTSILTVSENDAEAFRMFGLRKPFIQAVGETRYDQVWQRSEEAKTKHLIPGFILRKKKVIVVGSSWEEDEEVLIPTLRKMVQYDSSILIILVPHEPTLTVLENIEIRLNFRPKSIRFSDLNDYSGEPVIIVDSIGILMSLYQYADVAYVGGSFRQGVHNVLEPAVYGIPVVYGPRHENSQEAVALARRGGGFVVRDQQECYRTIRMLMSETRERKHAGSEALKLVKENIGATERFLEHLEKVL
ncbi:MAG TPA: glycosyltransferase N-terminal domain-containing protein [Bacteroidota bacterium]|nr:glycosyltransferase N-terminal domain-containing protein [Bacteroidota bacterium]